MQCAECIQCTFPPLISPITKLSISCKSPRRSSSSKESKSDSRSRSGKNKAHFAGETAAMFFVFVHNSPLNHSFRRQTVYNLNRYPTPQMVSMYCGLFVFISIFSRIFLMCTVTVAISPIDSISHILRNNSSFVNT